MEIEEIYELAFYFMIYSFCGWLMESIYKSVLDKKIVNSGFLYGPFCPIYGIGTLIMLLFLNRFSYNIFILFVVSVIVLSIWEYIVGLGLETVFKIKYWDYSQKKFNIHGRVCLMHSIDWGVLGVLFINGIHPNVKKIIELIPSEAIKYIVLIIGAYMLIDMIISIIKIKNINLKIKILKEITKTLKEKTEELKEAIGDSQASKKLKQTIDELKDKQEELKVKLEKQTQRLRTAFPTMRLKNLGEAINKRIREIRGEK